MVDSSEEEWEDVDEEVSQPGATTEQAKITRSYKKASPSKQKPEITIGNPIEMPHSHDVIWGMGGHSNHDGNKFFNAIVIKHRLIHNARPKNACTPAHFAQK